MSTKISIQDNVGGKRRANKSRKPRATRRNGPARRTKRKNRGISRSIMKSKPMHATLLAQSMLDPWASSACIPDGSRGIGCFSVKETGTLSSGAGGTVCGIALGMNPGAQKYIDSGSVSTNAVVTGNWAAASGLSAISAQYSRVRPVSAGLRLTYTGATQTDEGISVAGQVPAGYALSNYNASGLSTISATEQYYKTVPIRNGVQIVWRPDDMDDQMQFQAIAGTTAVSALFTYPILAAWVFGVNVNTAGIAQYEFVVNYEGQFNSQSYIPGGINSRSNNNPAEPGWYENAVNIVNQFDPIVPLIGSTFGPLAGGIAGLASGVVKGGLQLANGLMYPSMNNRSSRSTV